MKTLIISVFLACWFPLILASALPETKDGGVEKEVKFVKLAGLEGMGEVRVAGIGIKKAEKPEVKALAEMLVKDHSANVTELKALAEKKGIDVSSVVEEKIIIKIKDLEKKSGKNFDDSFLQFMEKTHKDSIEKFEDGQKEIKDREVKAYIEKTLAVLRAHHLIVKSLLHGK